MKDADSKVCTFAASPIYVFIINNSGKVGLVLALLSWFIYLGNQDRLNSNVMLLCLAIIVGLPYLFGLTQSRFTQKVVVDFNKSTLSLYMLRSNEVITVSFGKIDKINIKGYIIFELSGRKVYCNSAADKKLIDCLNRIMPVT